MLKEFSTQSSQPVIPLTRNWLQCIPLSKKVTTVILITDFDERGKLVTEYFGVRSLIQKAW